MFPFDNVGLVIVLVIKLVRGPVSSPKPLKCPWTPKNLHTIAQMATEILNVSSADDGPKIFCQASKIVILGSPAGNCSNNTKFCPCIW